MIQNAGSLFSDRAIWGSDICAMVQLQLHTTWIYMVYVRRKGDGHPMSSPVDRDQYTH